jgi:hypothetical protein
MNKYISIFSSILFLFTIANCAGRVSQNSEAVSSNPLSDASVDSPASDAIKTPEECMVSSNDIPCPTGCLAKNVRKLSPSKTCVTKYRLACGIKVNAATGAFYCTVNKRTNEIFFLTDDLVRFITPFETRDCTEEEFNLVEGLPLCQ